MNPTDEHTTATALNGGAEVSAEVLSTLAEIGEEVNASLDLDEVLARSAALIKRHIDYEIFGVLMIEGDGTYLRHRFAIGYSRELADNLRISLGQGITGTAAATGHSVRVSDTSKDPRYINAIDSVRSELAVPLMLQGKCVGVLDIQSRHLDYFTKDQQNILTLLASRLAVAIENARLFQKVRAQADTLLLGSLKGAKVVGIYGIADRGSDLILLLTLIVSTALAPQIASLYASGDIAGIERVVIKFARATFLCSLPVALAFVGFGFWYLLLFYGSAFTAGQQALTILSIGKTLSVLIGLPGMILIMTGYERDAARAIGFSAIITILLNLLLIPRWGLEGTAVATASTTVLWNILMAVLLYKRLGIHCTALGRISFKQASHA